MLDVLAAIQGLRVMVDHHFAEAGVSQQVLAVELVDLQLIQVDIFESSDLIQSATVMNSRSITNIDSNVSRYIAYAGHSMAFMVAE